MTPPSAEVLREELERTCADLVATDEQRALLVELQALLWKIFRTFTPAQEAHLRLLGIFQAMRQLSER